MWAQGAGDAAGLRLTQVSTCWSRWRGTAGGLQQVVERARCSVVGQGAERRAHIGAIVSSMPA